MKRRSPFGIWLAVVSALLVWLTAFSPAMPTASAATYTFRTLCLHGTSECLNDTLCQLHSVQIWNVNTGWKCSLTATQVGTVDPSGWPFYCDDGLNFQFAGLPVFFVGYHDSNTGIDYGAQSAGDGNTVTLTPVGSPDPNSLVHFIGFWVADHVNPDGTVTNADMIDAFETCNDGTAPTFQSAYAGCGGSGCLVREDIFSHSDSAWDWEQFTVNIAAASAGTGPDAMPALTRSAAKTGPSAIPQRMSGRG